jgi:hypothetical protein
MRGASCLRLDPTTRGQRGNLNAKGDVPGGQRGQRLYGVNGGTARGERWLRAASVRAQPGEGAMPREGVGGAPNAEVAGRGERGRSGAQRRIPTA